MTVERIPLVIDTDTAQDDCVAILIGLMDPRADLRAVTMVAGNVDFERQIDNARLTFAAAGRTGTVPLHRGCARPLLKPWVSAVNVHGDGAGGLRVSGDMLETDDEHGVDALVRLAAEHAGELRIVAIGPLTNVALATVKDPAFVGNVHSLWIMGGSNNGRGNITASAEFNFYVDPEAAQIVLDAGFDITLVPWDPLTLDRAVLEAEEMARIIDQGTPLAELFAHVCRDTEAFNRSVGIAGSTHPDSLTAYLCLHPETITRAAGHRVDVEIASTLTRGHSSMAWAKFGLAPNARVVEDVDRVAFLAHLTAVIGTPTEPDRRIVGADAAAHLPAR